METTATAATEFSCLESKTRRASTSPTNDLCVESIAETTATAATEVSCLESRASTSPTNDLHVESIAETTATAATEVSCLESKTRRASTSSMTAVNHTTAATDSLIAQPNHTAFGSTASRKDDDDDKKGRLFDANESVHYFHRVDEDSCHGCINHSPFLNCSDSVPLSDTIPPPWVHVFSKSCQPSSQRTQAASIAHMELPVHPKARHRRNRRSLKKSRKQQQILSEVIVPPSIYRNLLSASAIKREIVVIDGGDSGNPPIVPPDGTSWRCVSVVDSIHLYVPDDSNPLCGLTSPRVDGVLPFIKMPRDYALSITAELSVNDIIDTLEECERLKKTSLIRGQCKRIFGDYQNPVMYTSVGVQVSRNSSEVLNCNSFLQKLPKRQWTILMKLMRKAEDCFERLADSEVISHIHHAKVVVPFKTMTSPFDSTNSLNYYGGLAFGRNVFLRCHTDEDFTMSMVNVHLKGLDKYSTSDPTVVYFCFPTLGVAVPLRPGDFLLFNPRIPHCVSSRCRQADEVFSVSMYLKTAVVGMNNNQLPVDCIQSHLSKRYRQLFKH